MGFRKEIGSKHYEIGQGSNMCTWQGQKQERQKYATARYTRIAVPRFRRCMDGWALDLLKETRSCMAITVGLDCSKYGLYPQH